MNWCMHLVHTLFLCCMYVCVHELKYACISPCTHTFTRTNTHIHATYAHTHTHTHTSMYPYKYTYKHTPSHTPLTTTQQRAHNNNTNSSKINTHTDAKKMSAGSRPDEPRAKLISPYTGEITYGDKINSNNTENASSGSVSSPIVTSQHADMKFKDGVAILRETSEDGGSTTREMLELDVASNTMQFVSESPISKCESCENTSPREFMMLRSGEQVCMCVCMYVCMYVCLCVYICMHASVCV
jgi:hypothetical protein